MAPVAPPAAIKQHGCMCMCVCVCVLTVPRTRRTVHVSPGALRLQQRPQRTWCWLLSYGLAAGGGRN